ncbi:5-methylcytosine restriction system specificity protein McrC [Teichococcus aestuarii]|uniref:5-methylcytosine restriction system specificity protein McrC n=1 Tax=Teichococcus aestuarii TaxID=568898 RepID=UPI0015E8206C|nr:hypothetical protein [Pseudoroseomonas aestuarii]
MTQLSRNTRHYDLLLRICALILDNLLPGEGQSRTRFADLLEDEVRMSTVFEAFLRNFYRAEQSIFRVSAEHIAWDAHCADPAHAVFLPRMRTDVTLRSLGRTIVMDAKYHKKTLSRFRDGPETLKSENLYQMLTYLQHIDHNTPAAAKAEGLLLYPRVTAQDLRLDYTLAGHRVRVCTLNLDQPWTAIHQDLLTFLN